MSKVYFFIWRGVLSFGGGYFQLERVCFIWRASFLGGGGSTSAGGGCAFEQEEEGVYLNRRIVFFWRRTGCRSKIVV